MVCMAVSLWSCSNDDAPVVGGPENGKVSAEAQAALFQLYPNATDVNWSVKGEYVVADFNMAATRAAAGEYAAWFDNAGRWYMTTDSEILFDQLPAEVKTAFGESDYIPVAPAAGVDAFLKANFPNARILDIDREDNMTEVEILDGKVVRELLFDGTGNWLFTKTEMSYAALPAVVKQALDASEYAGYRVDDVDHYVTSAEEYYRLELESVMGDVKVKITATGELSPMEQNPAGPGNNTGGILTDKIKEFITQKYAGARIIESDMEKGMTEVEIFHEGREKDVYFNGAQDWVRTEWGVRVNELPAAVLDVIRKTYADYRIDDADYVETRTESYYLVELERGENEVDLRILPNGTIL